MKKFPKVYKERLLVGRFEWCSLINLKIPAIKVKVDSGAKTSSLHAFDIQPYVKEGVAYVKFKVHPLQGNSTLAVKCRAKIIDTRTIMSSNGHAERRFVIMTKLQLGEQIWPIELTLSNRDPLRFRMLLGREAMGNHTVIVPDKMLIQGHRTKDYLDDLYSSVKT
tara:strand:+ start:18 stop:512 length:495 start_codon:yes stop_codon:yes gene_type:complete